MKKKTTLTKMHIAPSTAVSYTHLDVYKRQHERSSDFQAANSMLMDSSDDGSLAFETE